MYITSESVKGRVKIVITEGTRVWHSGFTLNIEQYLHYLDPFVSSDLCAREMRVTVDTQGNNCWLEGTTYLNFSIPLGKQYTGADCHASYSPSDLVPNPSRDGRPLTFTVKDTVQSLITSGIKVDPNSSRVIGDPSPGSGDSENLSYKSGKNDNLTVCRWLPTYIGEAFGLRHSLMITLLRPWYAHSPELCIPLKLYSTVQQSLSYLKDKAEKMTVNGDGDDSDDEEDSYHNPRPLSLIISDFSGVCNMTIPSRWVDLDKPIIVKITLKDYVLPIVSMHLLLIRTELVHDAHKDTIIFVHKVFGQASEELLENFPPEVLHSEGCRARIDEDRKGGHEMQQGDILPEAYDPQENHEGHVPQGDDPVQGGDGLCGTFLFEFPMGNAPQLYNTSATSSSSVNSTLVSTMNALSVDTSRSDTPPPPPPGHSPLGSGTGEKSLMVPRSNSPSPCNSEKSLLGRGWGSKNTYKDQILERQEMEAEAEKRRNRLYSSFDSIQQEGEPFGLHHRVDSDQESDDENDEEEEVYM